MMNDAQDFAERVKKFYYYRALLCEQLINKTVTVNGRGIEMPPADFNPFANFYVDAYVINCAAIDGLASIWESISQCQYSGNRDRFTAFLIHLDTHNQMERICTPFLVFFLKKQGIEEPFANEVKAKWLENRREREPHRVYADSTVSELKTIYEYCHRQHPISAALSLKNPDSAISAFTYAALIYKFYRCSFVHEFRASQFATFFNKNNEISIREFAASISPSGVEIKFDEVKPQLDIGIGVLTESIRRGADTVFDLIVDKQCTDIPYASNDEVKLKVKQKLGDAI
jgi:hypothetical protein